MPFLASHYLLWVPFWTFCLYWGTRWAFSFNMTHLFHRHLYVGFLQIFHLWWVLFSWFTTDGFHVAGHTSRAILLLINPLGYSVYMCKSHTPGATIRKNYSTPRSSSLFCQVWCQVINIIPFTFVSKSWKMSIYWEESSNSWTMKAFC